MYQDKVFENVWLKSVSSKLNNDLNILKLSQYIEHFWWIKFQKNTFQTNVLFGKLMPVFLSTVSQNILSQKGAKPKDV